MAIGMLSNINPQVVQPSLRSCLLSNVAPKTTVNNTILIMSNITIVTNANPRLITFSPKYKKTAISMVPMTKLSNATICPVGFMLCFIDAISMVYCSLH